MATLVQRLDILSSEVNSLKGALQKPSTDVQGLSAQVTILNQQFQVIQAQISEFRSILTQIIGVPVK